LSARDAILVIWSSLSEACLFGPSRWITMPDWNNRKEAKNL
jgi:hypothetical protein